jgi:hypothetical protein
MASSVKAASDVVDDLRGVGVAGFQEEVRAPGFGKRYCHKNSTASPAVRPAALSRQHTEAVHDCLAESECALAGGSASGISANVVANYHATIRSSEMTLERIGPTVNLVSKSGWQPHFAC